jgi:hypothetical protein
MTEPTISINGHTLTEGQAMAVRVAVGSFLLLNSEPDSLGDDEHGRRMTQAYAARLMEVQKLMGEA